MKIALAKLANRLYESTPALHRLLYAPYKAWSDRTERAVLRKLVQPGMTVLDVGANIGVYTAFFAGLVGPTGRVVSFEPEPINVARLRDAVAALPQVHVVQAGVTERSGSIELFVSSDLNVDHHTYGGEGRQSIKVPAVALDDFVKDGDQIDLIKMDIQGAELDALRGARRLLSRRPGPKLLIEYWPYGLRQAGEDPQEMLTLLEALGYRWEVLGNAPVPSASGRDINAYVNLFAATRA